MHFDIFWNSLDEEKQSLKNYSRHFRSLLNCKATLRENCFDQLVRLLLWIWLQFANTGYQFKQIAQPVFLYENYTNCFSIISAFAWQKDFGTKTAKRMLVKFSKVICIRNKCFLKNTSPLKAGLYLPHGYMDFLKSLRRLL